MYTSEEIDSDKRDGDRQKAWTHYIEDVKYLLTRKLSLEMTEERLKALLCIDNKINVAKLSITELKEHLYDTHNEPKYFKQFLNLVTGSTGPMVAIH